MTVTTTRFQRGPNWQPSETWSHANGGTGLTRCGGCDQVWWQSGNDTSHCGMCHETFTSLAGFDHHLRHDGERVRCNAPWDAVDAENRRVFEPAEGYHLGETIRRYWRTVETCDRSAAS